MGQPPQMPPQMPPNWQTRAQWKAQRAQWKAQARMQRDAWRAQMRARSRGSLLGPIFLVAIGLVFLLINTGHIDIVWFWQWYGHWWPLILIGAGVLLALESLAFSGHSRVRLGGGVVFLMLMLAVIGVAAAHNHVNWSAVGDQLHVGDDDFNLSQILNERHEATEKVDHPLPANATIVLQNPHGDVTVTASSGAEDGQLHLTLNKSVYTNSDSESQRKLQSLEPLITTSGNVVTIHMPSNEMATADMALLLPASATLQIDAGHGDVSVSGQQAPVTVNAGHGDITVTAISGNVQATMHDGDFSAHNVQANLNLTGHMNDVTVSQVAGTVTMDGDFFGDVHLDTVTGALHLHSSRTDIQVAHLAGSVELDGDDLTLDNAAGPVTIATQAKDVTLRKTSGDLEVHDSNGDVDASIVQPLGTTTIDDRNGSVEMHLPGDGKFSVDATSVGGEIHTDFDLAKKNGGNSIVQASGAVNGGGPTLRITAQKGDITLHKAE